MDRSQWQTHVHEEVAFWDNWLRTGGGAWPDDFRQRVDSQQRLPDLIENVLRSSGVAQDSTVRILDLGSGPLTSVGSVSEHYRIEVVPVDPLADHYRSLLEKHRIAAPVLPQQGEAEKLDCLFQPESFDVVWARNSLDHSYDPLSSIFQALKVLKKGGTMIIVFHPNEADHGNYQGLHNWNFDIRKNNFVIESRGCMVNVSALLGKVCKVKIPAQFSRGRKANMHVKLMKSVAFGLFDLMASRPESA